MCIDTGVRTSSHRSQSCSDTTNVAVAVCGHVYTHVYTHIDTHICSLVSVPHIPPCQCPRTFPLGSLFRAAGVCLGVLVPDDLAWQLWLVGFHWAATSLFPSKANSAPNHRYPQSRNISHPPWHHHTECLVDITRPQTLSSYLPNPLLPALKVCLSSP